MKKQKFFFNIDILGTCNLKCPSCPSGNYTENINPRGFMSPELLEKIMTKADQECQMVGAGLFNWNEPVLHPKLPELIRIVQSHKVPCYLSSNLNHFPNMEAVLEANPHSLRVSNSGFRQEVYGRTHRGGDIERVKANMKALAEAKKKTGATTRIHVLYHRYKGNLEDELMMRQFSADLGFEWDPVWAFMMPLEKILAFLESEFADVELTEDDRALIDYLALPLKPALELSKKYRHRPCSLRDDQMTLDFMGNVQLCCATFDLAKYSLGSYLDVPFEDLQAMKYRHEMCGPCMDNGIHVYWLYGLDAFDRMAADNVDPEQAKALGLRAERARKFVRKRLEMVWHKMQGFPRSLHG